MPHFNRLIGRLLLSISCIGFAVPAAASTTDIRWLPETDAQGLTVNMPRIDNDVLATRLAELQARLKQDKVSLSKQVEQTRMKGKDTVLAAVLPGGLIYAAYKKTVHSRAVKQYKLVETQLAVIDQDIASFKADNGPIVIAHAQ
jgi:hypothetical protein